MDHHFIKKIINLKKIFKKGVLNLHEPYLDNHEKKFLEKCHNSNFVSTAGNFINRFEDEIKKYTGCKYAIALNSGTSALHLSLISIGVSQNNEVVLPSATFVGTVNPILYLKAKPVFVDIDNQDLCICPIKLEIYLKKNYYIKNNICVNKSNNLELKAIIYVDLFGNIGQIEKVKKIAKKFKLKLIEDAAEAFGSFKNNIHAGLFSDIGTLSFNGNKIITTGSGGALITNNSKIYRKIKHLSSTAKIRHQFKFIHDEIGFNYRMNNLSASLGLAQMKKIKSFKKSKRKLNKFYIKYFQELEGIEIFDNPSKSVEMNYWINVALLKKPSSIKIDNLIKTCMSNRIYLRRLWNPLHTLSYLNKFDKDSLENTIRLSNTMIALPSSSFLKYIE